MAINNEILKLENLCNWCDLPKSVVKKTKRSFGELEILILLPHQFQGF